MRLKKALQ